MICDSPNCPYREIVHEHNDGYLRPNPNSILAAVNQIRTDQEVFQAVVDELFHKVQVELGTLSERIDEIWDELRER